MSSQHVPESATFSSFRRSFRGWSCLTSRIVVALLSLCSLSVGQDCAYVYVLGIAQDGGYPQAGCQRACCQRAWRDRSAWAHVVSLAIVDPSTQQRWLVECTPDFREQLHTLHQVTPWRNDRAVDGILLTHAHIGHYAGLLQLGREVMGTRGIPVYAMPRFARFLRQSGPWSQLVELGNIELVEISESVSLQLNHRIQVSVLRVPHRDEYSETVAFRIQGPQRSVLFLPDIDKWEKWQASVETELTKVDVAFLDATFFDQGELPGRNMAEIPHPFVRESMERFGSLDEGQRAKIRFIHLNHTNPLLDPTSEATRRLESAGMRVARQGEQIDL